MIMKPQGYDEAPAFTGESVTLPAGLYVCEIIQATEVVSRNERKQLALLFDIAEGEHKGFYAAQFAAAKRMDENAKWKGVHKQTEDGTSLSFFKGLITSIEKSNPGYSFPWGKKDNEKSLVGKKFGAVMRRDQFLTNDGRKAFATKIIQVRSVEGLKDAKVPEDHLLADDEGDRFTSAVSYNGPVGNDGFMNIPEGIDEELPFM